MLQNVGTQSFLKVMLLTAFILPCAYASGSQKESPPTVEEEQVYLIRLAEKLKKTDRDALFERLKLQEKAEISKILNLFSVTSKSARPLSELQNEVSKEKAIKYIEPNQNITIDPPVKKKLPEI